MFAYEINKEKADVSLSVYIVNKIFSCHLLPMSACTEKPTEKLLVNESNVIGLKHTRHFVHCWTLILIITFIFYLRDTAYKKPPWKSRTRSD